MTEPILTPQGRQRARKATRATLSGGARQGARAGRPFGGFFSASPSSLAAAEAVTTGSLIAYDLIGTADKKLPRPGPILAAAGFYSILGFAAAASSTLAPAIVASGWVLALSVLVTGKRGQGVVKLLAGMARLAAKVGAENTSSGGSGK